MEYWNISLLWLLAIISAILPIQLEYWNPNILFYSFWSFYSTDTIGVLKPYKPSWLYSLSYAHSTDTIGVLKHTYFIKLPFDIVSILPIQLEYWNPKQRYSCYCQTNNSTDTIGVLKLKYSKKLQYFRCILPIQLEYWNARASTVSSKGLDSTDTVGVLKQIIQAP